MGVRCPVGLTAPQTAAAIRAGISRIGEHPYLTDASRAKVLCGVDASLDPVLQGPARFAGLAGPALLQVDAILSAAQAASPRVPLLLALLGLLFLGVGLVILRRGRKDRHLATGSQPVLDLSEVEQMSAARAEPTSMHEGV